MIACIDLCRAKIMPTVVKHGLWVLGACLYAATAVVPIAAKSHTHVDPDGAAVSWYPKECCDDGDCRPVVGAKRTTRGVWLTTVDGYTVLVGPNDVRLPSRDARWHICVGPIDVVSLVPTITCIFEPAGS